MFKRNKNQNNGKVHVSLMLHTKAMNSPKKHTEHSNKQKLAFEKNQKSWMYALLICWIALIVWEVQYVQEKIAPKTLQGACILMRHKNNGKSKTIEKQTIIKNTLKIKQLAKTPKHVILEHLFLQRPNFGIF